MFVTVSNVLQWVEPAVHACRSEAALGCTMWEAGLLPRGEFRLLYLLCMLRFPIPLHSLHHIQVNTLEGAPSTSCCFGFGIQGTQSWHALLHA
jgi:hypothetical protein